MERFKHRIDVSPEMMSFVGGGALPPADWPAQAIFLHFTWAEGGGQPLIRIFDPARGQHARPTEAALVFVVARAAIQRLFGPIAIGGEWHLPAALRPLVAGVLDPGAPGEEGDTLRLARSIELLCAVFDHQRRDALVPADLDGSLTEADAARIVQARRLIDERWHEKLTLDAIARACGLNRGKLTRGFRSLYACTVADALTEQRLTGARHLLEATDLPVSTIGYRCGYLSNASFTRAFARHVGLAPTRWRAARRFAA